MSFVSVVAGENFISLMSDGRVTLGEQILEENFQKYTEINDHIFIAYAGEREPIYNLLGALNHQVVSRGDFFKTATDIKEALETHKAFIGKKAMFIIGGINKNSQIEFVLVSTKDSPLSYIPENEQTKLMSGYAFNLKDTTIEYEDLNKKLDDFFGEENNHLGNAQKRLHEYVAGLDFSCNKVIFQKVIQK